MAIDGIVLSFIQLEMWLATIVSTLIWKIFLIRFNTYMRHECLNFKENVFKQTITLHSSLNTCSSTMSKVIDQSVLSHLNRYCWSRKWWADNFFDVNRWRYQAWLPKVLTCHQLITMINVFKKKFSWSNHCYCEWNVCLNTIVRAHFRNFQFSKAFFSRIWHAVVLTQFGNADSKSAPCQAIFCVFPTQNSKTKWPPNLVKMSQLYITAWLTMNTKTSFRCIKTHLSNILKVPWISPCVFAAREQNPKWPPLQGNVI